MSVSPLQAVAASKVVTDSTGGQLLRLAQDSSIYIKKPLTWEAPQSQAREVTLAQTVQLDRHCQTGGCCELWLFLVSPSPYYSKTAAP